MDMNKFIVHFVLLYNVVLCQFVCHLTTTKKFPKKWAILLSGLRLIISFILYSLNKLTTICVLICNQIVSIHFTIIINRIEKPSGGHWPRLDS